MPTRAKNVLSLAARIVVGALYGGPVDVENDAIWGEGVCATVTASALANRKPYAASLQSRHTHIVK